MLPGSALEVGGNVVAEAGDAPATSAPASRSAAANIARFGGETTQKH
jgi:hypothetical protein